MLGEGWDGAPCSLEFCTLPDQAEDSPARPDSHRSLAPTGLRGGPKTACPYRTARTNEKGTGIFKNSEPDLSKKSDLLADAPQGVGHHEQDRAVTDRVLDPWQGDG